MKIDNNLGGFVVGFVEGDGAVHQDVEFDGTVAHDAGNEFKEEQYDVYCSSYQSHLIYWCGSFTCDLQQPARREGSACSSQCTSRSRQRPRR